MNPYEKIKVNNNNTIELEENKVTYRDNNNNIYRELNISDGDIVMLLNYYINCKSGIEKSEYILEEKIK